MRNIHSEVNPSKNKQVPVKNIIFNIFLKLKGDNIILKKICTVVMNPFTHHVGDSKEHIFEVLRRNFVK